MVKVRPVHFVVTLVSKLISKKFSIFVLFVLGPAGTTTLGEGGISSDDDTSPDDDYIDDMNDGMDDDLTTGKTTTFGENDLSSDDDTSPDADAPDDENDGTDDDFTTIATSADDDDTR